MQLHIDPFKSIIPKIYAYTTPEIARHDGWIKIGYTTQPLVEKRILQQTQTAGVRFYIEWWQKARYTTGNGAYFTDHEFHEYLERYKGIEREPKTEWFHVAPKAAEQMFYDFADRNYADVQISANRRQYILRDEQQQAVGQTLAYYQKCRQTGDKTRAEFLWNAKPRFGKTLTTYDLMRHMEAKMVLILTNRPAIANSWYDDFEKFISWQTPYRFVSTSDSLKNQPTLTREQFLDEQLKADEELRMVAFLSLQDLKGSMYFGGEFDKLKWVADNKWDLLVLDEAHEGVDTYKTDWAIDKIKHKFTLHLSGTPFKALANNKFSAEQIFNWTFTDEQQAKEAWSSEAANPYADMPRMNMYTYQMSQLAIDRVNRGIDLSGEDTAEFAFDLNEFFSTNERGKFVHQAEVKKFLDALCEQEKFPFSTPELRSELKHTFWILERVSSARALAKMLQQHPVFENYAIILAAGDGQMQEDDGSRSKKSLERVKEAIREHDRTITLSVGQLTTGVTIPEWTAVFMLSNMKSPAEYIQAAFRAQNPYKFVQDGKYYRKENAYIFDFAPERTLLIFDQFANSLYTSTAGGKGTKEQREENVKRLLNFFAVYAEDEAGKMVQLDAERVLTIPVKIKADEVIRRGFMSNLLFTNIGSIFNAPSQAVEIIEKLEPVREQDRKKEANALDGLQDVAVDEDGQVLLDEEIVINQTQAIFGEKIYETEPVNVKTTYAEVGDDPEPEAKLVENIVNHVAETIKKELFTKAAEGYGIKAAAAERIEEQLKKENTEKLQPIIDDFKQQPQEVFKEVTGISVEEFQQLRDGFAYEDEATGEKKHYKGGLFDEVVFNAAVKEFLNKKRELANYFAEQSDEDIFDYIPPQQTNQIFTPKKVVQMMVDQLVETNPHIFESPDKTFVDFYMKSGLYITEIVKRLYRNPVLKSLYPNDKERVKHILECQVFGFAPTQIIYDITMSYIFGFDEDTHFISRRNFFHEDTLPWAKQGNLQELVNKKLGDRVTE